MLPLNEESFKFLKELAIREIKDKQLKRTSGNLTKSSIDKTFTNNLWSRTPKVTGIEKRFQEEMINEMDSQY